MIALIKTNDPDLLAQIQALAQKSKHSIMVQAISLTPEQEAAIALEELGINSSEPCFNVMVEAIVFSLSNPNFQYAKDMYVYITSKLSISKYASQEAITSAREIICSQKTLPEIIKKSFEHERTNNLVGLVRSIAKYVVHSRATEEKEPSVVLEREYRDIVTKTLKELNMDSVWLFLVVLHAIKNKKIVSSPSEIRRAVALRENIKVETLNRYLREEIKCAWLRGDHTSLRKQLFDVEKVPNVSEFIQTTASHILKKYF